MDLISSIMKILGGDDRKTQIEVMHHAMNEAAARYQRSHEDRSRNSMDGMKFMVLKWTLKDQFDVDDPASDEMKKTIMATHGETYARMLAKLFAEKMEGGTDELHKFLAEKLDVINMTLASPIDAETKVTLIAEVLSEKVREKVKTIIGIER